MSAFRLDGLVAAPYTPFNREGDLNLVMVERQVEELAAAGLAGAFVCGTTGEGVSLTIPERMAVAQRWVEVAGRTLKVIVHVGHDCQREATALAAHARQIGASAIAAMPPCFFKPGSVERLVEFMRPVAAAGGDLPFYYYHFPSMTGVALSMAELLEAAGERIPTLHGIKFTHGDLLDYQRCRVVRGGKFEIAWGFDEMLLAALAVGAQSAVGSTYNYAGRLYISMMNAYRKGDMQTAQRCSQRAVDMVSILVKHGVLRTGKATMAMIGIDCGPTRAPVLPLDAAEATAVRRAFEQIGFFDWAR